MARYIPNSLLFIFECRPNLQKNKIKLLGPLFGPTIFKNYYTIKRLYEFTSYTKDRKISRGQ